MQFFQMSFHLFKRLGATYGIASFPSGWLLSAQTLSAVPSGVCVAFVVVAFVVVLTGNLSSLSLVPARSLSFICHMFVRVCVCMCVIGGYFALDIYSHSRSFFPEATAPEVANVIMDPSQRHVRRDRHGLIGFSGQCPR